VETPVPGPGQLLVRVRAASVNPVDWKMRKGQLRLVRRARFPLVLGFDVAGEVEAVGPEVDAFDVGDAVYAFTDNPHGGGYAESVLVGEAAAARKPERLSFEEAAAVPLAALTALQAVRDRGELETGERLLVNGAAGGVGHFAVQIGRALGARVVGVASGRNQDFLRELGVARGIDYEQEDFATDDETYHVVFDTVGNSDLRESDLILEEGGVFVTTSIQPSVLAQTAITSFLGLFGPARRCRPVIVKPKGQDLAALTRLIDTGRLHPHIEEIYPLDQIAEAHRRSETGRVRGKLVIRVE
jgi:NADPH:quinone reductase-like Zn-dependent oxidoreductase